MEIVEGVLGFDGLEAQVQTPTFRTDGASVGKRCLFRLVERQMLFWLIQESDAVIVLRSRVGGKN